MPAALWPDLVAPAFFLACWIGYAWWADRGGGYQRSLMARVADLRQHWMRQMLLRDVRIVDIQIVQVLVNAIAFFASSVVLVIGGGLALLGARDQVIDILVNIPFAAASPTAVWEAKILLLVMIFTYAFFKLTWALRQFNYVAILVGAAPPPVAEPSPAMLAYADQAAQVANRAAEHFNKAMRSYYFGLAALTWLIQPWLLVATSLLVVLVVYRREFRSGSLALITSVAGRVA